jgi:membrane-associated phospholipid phosphatase
VAAHPAAGGAGPGGPTLTRTEILHRPRLRPAGWWVEVALAVGFAALTVSLRGSSPLTWFDRWLRDLCDAHRPPAAYWLARAVNLVGNGGWIMTVVLLLALLLAVRRRTVRPLLPPVAAAILSGALLVPLKAVTARPAPHHGGPVPAFTVPGQESYPSGHLVNAIVWYGLAAALLAPYLPVPARRVLRAAPPVLVFCSTLYLGFHWFTDDLAGLALGALVYRIVCRVPWSALPLPPLLERRPPPSTRPWP